MHGRPIFFVLLGTMTFIYDYDYDYDGNSPNEDFGLCIIDMLYYIM